MKQRFYAMLSDEQFVPLGSFVTHGQANASAPSTTYRVFSERELCELVARAESVVRETA